MVSIRMTYCRPAPLVCGFLLLVALLMYVFYYIILTIFSYMHGEGISGSWVFRLSLNLLGYATIFVPGFALFLYVKKIKLDERYDRGFWSYLLKVFFVESDKKNYTLVESSETPSLPSSFFKESCNLIFCSAGLLSSYLIWGLLQERIMTQVYVNAEGEKGKFGNSQFLVFVNRILAFILAGLAVLIMDQPRHTVPLYKYSYCSFSNIMSSWCQYEALKFISFPTQVLSKACKLIPVMLMGKIVSRRKYEYYEYVTALMICIGMVLFIYGSPDVTNDNRPGTTVSGFILIVSYMVFDSFTSNWQSELFSQYSTSSLQMMLGVNFFSCLLTTVSLLQQEGFLNSLLFSVKYPSFAFDCVVLSICSAVGQIFVFYTISSFGPVVFIIIMTFRQAVAIILSAITYHHFISLIGVFGITVVFTAIFLRIYCSHRLKMLKKRVSSSATKV